MMNNSVSATKRHKVAGWGWAGVCAALLVSLCLLWPGARINSSVLALLPARIMGDAPPDLQQGFMQRLDRQMVWLISPGKQADPAAAQWWLSHLRGLPSLQQVTGPMDAGQQQQWGQFAFEHRNALLDGDTRARLAEGGAAQAEWVLAQLYSAFAGVSGQELKHDPLLLVRGAQLALQKNSGQMGLTQGWLTTTDPQGRVWYFLHGELSGNAFDMAQSQQLTADLARLKSAFQAAYPQAKVLTRGSVLFSHHAGQQARQDVSTLGTATVGGVLLLIIAVFRSVRPLLLCVLSLSVGALAGGVMTLLFFGELHVMTLVMSISIVGISADYTLYYLTERRVHGAVHSPLESLHKVLPTLLLALATTVAAYLMMLLAPFPGVRQLAVFAAAGLTASCLTVVCWYPWLVGGLPVRPVPAMGLMGRWLCAWRRRPVIRLGLPLAVAVLSLAGWLRLTVNDDISQLQALPPGLMQQEREIAALTGQHSDQTFFMVYGDSAEQVLQRAGALVPGLQNAQRQQWLSHWRLLPLLSLQQQAQDQRLIAAAAPQVMQRLAEAGLAVAPPDVRAMPVTPDAWLASPLSEGWRLLWLTLPDGRSSLLIPVSGVQQRAALKQLADTQPGVVWVDRKSGFNDLFRFYRVMLSWLLLAALALLALSFTCRFGLRRGLVNMLPTLLSLGAGVAALSLGGEALNLFSLLALVLVLGIGINYTLFFSNPRGTPMTSLLAVTLAMGTTLMTLGMLVFSRTAAIASFGTVLCSGIFTAFLLAPLALPRSKGKPRKFPFRAGLLLSVLLSGCAATPGPTLPQAWLKPGVRVTLPAPGISPAIHGQQLLTGTFKGQQQSLVVLLNADAQRLSLAGLSSLGIRLFQLTYDAQGIHTRQSLVLPDLPPAAQVLADVMLGLWPVEAWQGRLPPGWTLNDEGDTRRLCDEHGKRVTEIRYQRHHGQRKPVSLEQYVFGYHITIQHLDD